MKAIDGRSGACSHSDMGCLGDSGGTYHCRPSNTQESQHKRSSWAWKLQTHDLILALRLAFLVHAHIWRGVSLALALGEGFLVGVGNSRLVSHNEIYLEWMKNCRKDGWWEGGKWNLKDGLQSKVSPLEPKQPVRAISPSDWLPRVLKPRDKSCPEASSTSTN